MVASTVVIITSNTGCLPLDQSQQHKFIASLLSILEVNVFGLWKHNF